MPRLAGAGETSKLLAAVWIWAGLCFLSAENFSAASLIARTDLKAARAASKAADCRNVSAAVGTWQGRHTLSVAEPACVNRTNVRMTSHT
jgi:hypothetical protein